MARTMNVQLQLDISAAERQLSQFAQNAQKISKGGSGIAGSLGGAAGLAGASAIAATMAAVGAEFNKLGGRARELAATAGNAASQLGQLRASIERNSISTDINATSPGVVGFQKFTADLGTNIGDAISHATSSAPDRAKALQEKIAGGLGQGNEDWRRLKEQGVDLAQDQGRAQTAMQVKYQRQARDFDLSQRKFQVDTENQKFDLQKQAARTQFDNQIAINKYNENFANVQSQKAYDLSRQFANQSFQISQGRSIQDYSLNRSDQQADYSRNKGDQQFDFQLNKSRSLEDRRNQLQDMALGGASGLQYFQAARDFNQAQNRATQDFAIQQKRENRDFGIGQGRDARNFGISMGRSNQDFQQQAKEALASRQLEIEAQEYARKYEGLELQTQINRQSQDLAISFQRLNQSIGFQQEGFANQKSDMAYDKNLDYSNFALQTGRQNRNYGYALADFAGSARSKDPLGAAGLGSQDPAFAAALAANARQSGQTDLFAQINAANNASNNSLGAKVGDTIKQGEDFWSNFGKGIDDLKKTLAFLDQANSAKPGGSNGAGVGGGSFENGSNNGSGGIGGGSFGTGQSIQTGANVYNFNSGMTPQDQQNIQSIADAGDAKTANAILDYIRKIYGG